MSSFVFFAIGIIQISQLIIQIRDTEKDDDGDVFFLIVNLNTLKDYLKILNGTIL